MTIKLDELEGRDRRENLVLHGIQETGAKPETWEETGRKLEYVCNEAGILLTRDMYHRAHRLHSNQRPRPVIVKFVNFKKVVP